MNAMVPSVFGNFALKGLDHFDRQLSKAPSRDYDHLNCFAKETQRASMAHFWKATSGITLGVQV